MVKSIKHISPSLLLSTEVVASGERLNQIIAPAVQNDPFVTSELAALNTSLSSLKAEIQSNRAGLYTGGLAAKDGARTSAFRGLVSMLQGVSGVQTKPDNKAAADYLLALIARQGNRVSNLSYARKTGAFASVLESLNQPDAQTYIKQLGLADMVTEFATAQDDFEALHQAKMKADGQLAGSSAKNQTTDVCYHIINLVQYVDAQAQRDPVFQGLVPEINSTVADIMAKAHARRTRSLDANVTPTPVPTPAPVTAAPSASGPLVSAPAEAVATSPLPGGNGARPKAEVLAQVV